VTKRLYYTDSYLTQFEAIVLHQVTDQDHPAVVLDQSAFYPTGGGQPHDTGTLNAIPVIDVVKDEGQDQVIHLLEAPLQAEAVVGQVDWPRRFDLMQQHSGQHILSQAILQTTEAATVGFHLSRDYATIDIAQADLSEKSLKQAELLANQIIYDNRAVTARFVSRQELANLPLRKQPAVEGPIRVVSIQDFDWSACGGTHVSQTGEVGVIKIIKSERRKRFLRLTFLCGQRALWHYQRINQQISSLALQLSVSIEEVVEALDRQNLTLKQIEKEKENLAQRLLIHEASALCNEAVTFGDVNVVIRVMSDKTVSEARQLAQQITQEANYVVLLGLMGQKGELVFARSAGVDLHMPTLLKRAGKIIGGGGGGSPSLAQGGGPNREAIPAALQEAKNWLKEQLSQ